MARRPRITNAFLEEQRRQRIIEAAGRLVAKGGPDAAKVSALVKEARTSRRCFYEAFRGRQDCLERLVEWVGQEAFCSASEAMFDADDRLEAGMEGLLSFIAQHPAEVEAYLLWGPAISPDEVARIRQRFAFFLSTSPGLREDFVIGAVERRLYRFFADGVAPSLVTSLRDELVNLVRAIYAAPAVASVHELSAPVEPVRAAA